MITAQPTSANALQDVILASADTRRAWHDEAPIVEMAEGDGINLGVQWGNLDTGAVIQYGNTGASIGGAAVGLEEAKDTETTTAVYDDNGAFVRNETDHRIRWLFNVSFCTFWR